MFVKSKELNYVDMLLERFRASAIMLHRPYPPIGFSFTRSRIGGLPNLPDNIEWPIGKNGFGNPVPMHFLAQIDCSELPEIDADMPTSGMIFFFGVDDEEQTWCDYPVDSVRVIYCEFVAPDQDVRKPPANLLPICGGYNAPPWQLPGELRSNVHASWPLVPLKIDSWPDASAIDGVVIESNRNHDQSKNHIQKMALSTLFQRAAPTKEEKCTQKVEFSKETTVLYARRLQAAQVAAILRSTELPTISKLEPIWGTMTCDFNNNPRFIIPDYLNGFPQIGLMIDRIARLIVRECISYKEHRSYQGEGHTTYLNSVEDSGRRWIEMSESIGLENTPSDEERSRFTKWIGDLGVPGEFHVICRSMQDIFTKSLLSCIEYASDKPELMLRIPEDIWKVFENFHLPISQHRARDGWRIEPFFHQMLGHARTCQELDSIEDAPVLLLQLQTDFGINMRFGDVGSAYFWIKREDLKLRRFDRVWGDVAGH